MNQQKTQLVFFYLFIFVVLVFNFFIFLPFASVLFLALIFAILFNPLHQRVLSLFNNRETISAIFSTVIVFLLIVGPISFIGTLLFKETSNLYLLVTSAENNGKIVQSIQNFNSGLSAYFPNLPFSIIEGDIEVYLKSGLSWFLKHFSTFFSGAINITVSLFLMLLTIFYFFKQGKSLNTLLLNISPLNDDYDRKIIDRVVIAVNSVVKGHLVIGLIQGLLTGIGFAIFGVPSPVIWGTVAMVSSMLPTFGTSLVLIPGIIFVFFTSGPLFGLGLLLWGILAVGLIDNLLGPALINRGMHVHPFLILLSVFGGLSLLGPIGFLAGPVILSILFALFDLYPAMVRDNNEDERISTA